MSRATVYRNDRCRRRRRLAARLLTRCAAIRAGREVGAWARDPTPSPPSNGPRQAPCLPGIELPETIRATAELAELQHVRRADRRGADAEPPRRLRRAGRPSLPRAPVISAAKGIELARRTVSRPQIVASAWPGASAADPARVPSFAADIGRGPPTAVTLACRRAEPGPTLAGSAELAGLPHLPSPDDPRGVEIGGAATNVLS